MEKAMQNDPTLKTEWTAPSVEVLETNAKTENGILGLDDGVDPGEFS